MTPLTDEDIARLRVILAERPADEILTTEHRRACVVLPLIRSAKGWAILFSRRSESLPIHRGQIAFPGGSVEPDEPLELAAVRETEEEVGIPRDQIELIGRLDDVVTNSGFVVAPFVGIIPSQFEYVLQQSEVAEVFEVPVHLLMQEPNPEVRYVEFRSKQFPAYFYRYKSTEIWGLTGRMLKGLLDLVWLAR